MSDITLIGYRTTERRGRPVYVLNTDSGRVDVQWVKNKTEDDAIGPKHGFGDYRRIGSMASRDRGFFAVYADATSLYLWVNGRQLDLLIDPVTIARSTVFWSIHEFRVMVKDLTLFVTRYWYTDWEDVPDEDLFWYMGRYLGTREGRIRNMLYWRDHARGVAGFSAAYQQDLKQRARSLMDELG